MERVDVGELVEPIGDSGFMMIEMGEDGFSFEVVSREGVLVGIVIEVVEYQPIRSYGLARLLVGDVVGWTYSDYVRRV